MWIGPFVADFACVEAKLVVEVDGSQHGESEEYDRARSALLAKEGYSVIRFWNNEVMGHLVAIPAALVSSPSQAFGLSPSLSPRGEGV